MQQIRSVIVILATLCMATIAFADPAKPNPSTSYTASVFAITQQGYGTARTFYDQDTLSIRTDLLDTNFYQVGEFIGSWSENAGYWYDSASGFCQVFPLNQEWVNSWDFLNDATFGGVDDSMACDLWLAPVDELVTMAACFSSDTPVYIGVYNGTEVDSLYFITSFYPAVDPSVFTVPSTCSSSFKLSSLPMMSLKKFKVPTHPLLF